MRIVPVLFLLLATAASARTCDAVISVGLGTYNADDEEAALIASIAPLGDEAQDLDVVIEGPDGDLLWLTSFSGEELALGTFESKGPGTYAVAAQAPQGAFTCTLELDTSASLPQVAPIEMSGTPSGVHTRWSPLESAAEYHVFLEGVEGRIIQAAVTSDNEYTFPGIEDGDYAVRVVAYTGPLTPIDPVTGEATYRSGAYVLNGSETTSSEPEN